MVVNGGAIARGAKGEVIHVVDDVDMDNLLHILKHNSKIVMYSLDKENQKPMDVDGAALMVAIMTHTMKNVKTKLVAKHFFGKNAKSDFQRELSMYRDLTEVFNKKINYYTSLTTLNVAGVSGIVGISIDVGSTTKYFLLNLGCEETIQSTHFLTIEDIIKATSELLESLRILQEKGFGHFDIKPDNIMKCGSHYRFIDWDLSHKIESPTQRFFSSRAFTSPAAWFMQRGVTKTMSLLMVKVGTGVYSLPEHKLVFNEHRMKAAVESIIEHYKAVFKGASKQQVFEKCAYTFDLYALGLSILFLLTKHKLVHNELEQYAMEMTKAKFVNARAALQEFYARFPFAPLASQASPSRASLSRASSSRASSSRASRASLPRASLCSRASSSRCKSALVAPDSKYVS